MFRGGTVEHMEQVEHSKKRQPLIIAHRGDSAKAPENTLAAFRRAIDVGADGVEFDVQLASDGVLVVAHDFDLKRTAGRSERITELTSKQLAKIDVGSRFNAKFPTKAVAAYADETVPTLEQVLKLYETTTGPIYIELKCDDSNYKPLASAICEMIRDSPMLPRMIVKSFKLAAIPKIRHLLPAAQTAALFEPSIMTILRKQKYIIAMAREFGAHQISLHYTLATPKLTALAAHAQMPVTIWTADNPRWIARCRERAIGSLITNDPSKMLAARDR